MKLACTLVLADQCKYANRCLPNAPLGQELSRHCTTHAIKAKDRLRLKDSVSRSDDGIVKGSNIRLHTIAFREI